MNKLQNQYIEIIKDYRTDNFNGEAISEGLQAHLDIIKGFIPVDSGTSVRRLLKSIQGISEIDGLLLYVSKYDVHIIRHLAAMWNVSTVDVIEGSELEWLSMMDGYIAGEMVVIRLYWEKP